MDKLIIVVEKSTEGGWNYDIFGGTQAQEDGNSMDGGKCTGSMRNAIEMAESQAKEIIKMAEREEKITECRECGCKTFNVLEHIVHRGAIGDGKILEIYKNVHNEIESVICTDCLEEYGADSFHAIDFNN